jgi:zona occludens toxin (predicted ATPase)
MKYFVKFFFSEQLRIRQMSGAPPISSAPNVDATTDASSDQAAWDAALEAALTPAVFGVGLGMLLMQQQFLSENLPKD